MLQRTGVGVANPNSSAARNAITCRPVSQDVSGFRPGLTGRRKTRSARDAGRSRREEFEFLLLGSPVRLVGHTTVCDPVPHVVHIRHGAWLAVPHRAG